MNGVSMAFKFLGQVLNPLKTSACIPGIPGLSPLNSTIQIRMSSEYWTDWRMQRDAKRRRVIKEFAKQRLQLNSMRKNDILPKQFQELVSKELHALPKDGSITRAHGRCVITSRARGKLTKWRMSRIMWRHLADYNQLSGVIRAMW